MRSLEEHEINRFLRMHNKTAAYYTQKEYGNGEDDYDKKPERERFHLDFCRAVAAGLWELNSQWGKAETVADYEKSVMRMVEAIDTQLDKMLTRYGRNEWAEDTEEAKEEGNE